MRVLDLFSGIGGFSLGLERAGMKTVAFCEIDPYCRRVLAKHWPGVPIHDDIKTLAYATGERCGQGRQGRIVERRQNGASESSTIYDGAVDVVCGGFPCQDISTAGQRAGIDGSRSGLWGEFARLIGEIRPRYAIVENVTALLHRGLDRVLGDLATLGYDAEWHCIPAAALGAPHRRDRVWIVGYPNEHSQPAGTVDAEAPVMRGSVADAESNGSDGEWNTWATVQSTPRGRCGGLRSSISDILSHELVGVANKPPSDTHAKTCRPRPTASQPDWWSVEPDVGRVANGVPSRTHRLRALGNAVVPQIPELIGRAILDAEGQGHA